MAVVLVCNGSGYPPQQYINGCLLRKAGGNRFLSSVIDRSAGFQSMEKEQP